MAYGMNQLRKAGKAFLDFDESFADALYADDRKQAYQIGHTLPIKYASQLVDDRNPRTGEIDNTAWGKTARGAIGAGLIGANIASRYALPAGGITLAGKGLIDLTGMLVGPNEQTDSAVMPGQ
jgi:hypothetical protein